MYKVLIADDEVDIRAGIAAIIDWAELGCTLLETVSNGKEALVSCQTNHPHIIVTDIKMPVLDGLALITEAKKLDPLVRIIVLSGYDDFEYVRCAMKHGAENYLLKPVDKDEFYQTLKEVILSLDKEHEDAPFMEEFGLFRNNLMSRLVRDDISYKEFRQKMEFLGVPLFDQGYMTAALDFTYLNYLSLQKKWDAGRDFQLFKKISDFLPNSNKALVFKDLSSTIGMLFSVNDKADVERACSTLEALVKELGPETECCTVMGPVVSSYRDISVSYKQTVSWLKTLMLAPIERVVSTENLEQCHKRGILEQEPKDEDIIGYFRRGEIEQLQKLIDSWYTKCSSGKGYTDASQLYVARIYDRLFDFVARETMLSPHDLLKVHPTEMSGALRGIRMVGVKQPCEDFLTLLYALWQGGKTHSYSPLVQKLMSHIEEKYQDYNISLKTLAHKLDSNPEHAGRVFKSETGFFFTDYLNQIRISRAEELLLNTTLPANEIALQVGFLNQNYFYTKFKNQTGINPTTFRKSGKLSYY
ncbi:MAG: response regulator [Sphaerochaeta sp.]|nr:response regulator [Sphaerochaeta sp.]